MVTITIIIVTIIGQGEGGAVFYLAARSILFNEAQSVRNCKVPTTSGRIEIRDGIGIQRELQNRLRGCACKKKLTGTQFIDLNLITSLSSIQRSQ